MLKRLLLALLLLSATIRVNAADYTDLWWNPAEGGWGVNLVQSDNFMFVTFFIVNIYLLMNGLFTPVDSMAPWLQKVSMINPVRHLVTISRAI